MLTLIALLSLFLCPALWGRTITFAPKYEENEFPGMSRRYDPLERSIALNPEFEPHGRNKELGINIYPKVYIFIPRVFNNISLLVESLSTSKLSLSFKRRCTRTRVFLEIDKQNQRDIIEGAFPPLLYEFKLYGNYQWYDLMRDHLLERFGNKGCCLKRLIQSTRLSVELWL